MLACGRARARGAGVVGVRSTVGQQDDDLLDGHPGPAVLMVGDHVAGAGGHPLAERRVAGRRQGIDVRLDRRGARRAEREIDRGAAVAELGEADVMQVRAATDAAGRIERVDEVVGGLLGPIEADVAAGRPLGLTHAARPVDDELDVERLESAAGERVRGERRGDHPDPDRCDRRRCRQQGDSGGGPDRPEVPAQAGRRCRHSFPFLPAPKPGEQVLAPGWPGRRGPEQVGGGAVPEKASRGTRMGHPWLVP